MTDEENQSLPGTDPRDILERLGALARVTKVETRMSDKQLGAEQQRKLRAEIDQWRRENNLSLMRLANALEVSKPVISQVISGTYRADPSKYLLALQGLMNDPAASRHLMAAEPSGLVRTSAVLDMETAVEWARRLGTCCLIFGPSGAGKTAYARARTQEKANCVYVHLDDERYSRSRLLRRIAEQLRITDERANAMASDQLLDWLSGVLQGLTRVIFVDNAHVLNKHGLWTLHSLHDRTGSTIVALGQPKLYDTVKNSRNDRGVGATIFARFGVKLDLSDSTVMRIDPTDPSRALKPARQWLHTLEDINKFLASRQIRLHPAAAEWLHKLVNCPFSGGFHTIEDLLTLSVEAYPEARPLTVQHLLQADRIVRPHEEQVLFRDDMAQVRPASGAAAG